MMHDEPGHLQMHIEHDQDGFSYSIDQCGVPVSIMPDEAPASIEFGGPEPNFKEPVDGKLNDVLPFPQTFRHDPTSGITFIQCPVDSCRSKRVKASRLSKGWTTPAGLGTVSIELYCENLHSWEVEIEVGEEMTSLKVRREFDLEDYVDADETEEGGVES